MQIIIQNLPWRRIGLVSACFLVLLGVRIFVNHGTTGDEPHYLLMDYSLEHDHDLNLSNNYQAGNYRQFYPAALSTTDQVGAGQQASHSKQYSIHGIGLPWLILPAFIIGKKSLVVVEMTAIATLVLVLTYMWCRAVTGHDKASLLTAACLLVSYFFNGLAGYIYPDMVSAALTLGALLILMRRYAQPVYQLIFSLLLGVLVLVHFRNFFVVAPLLLIMFYRHWHLKRRLPWYSLVILLPIVTYFFLTLHSWYGVWDPENIYSNNIHLKMSPLKAISAMLFDANRGLIVYNPIFLLIFAGLPLWFREKRNLLILTVVALGPSIVLLSFFNGWQGGGAPIGRYLVDFLPGFMPAITYVFIKAVTPIQKVFIAMLATATLGISLIATLTKVPYIDPAAYRTKPVLFEHIANVVGVHFDHLLPNFSNATTLNDRYGKEKLMVGYLILVGVFIYGYHKGPHARSHKLLTSYTQRLYGAMKSDWRKL